MMILKSFFILAFTQCCLCQLSRSVNLKDPPEQDGPVTVSLGVYIQMFNSISEKKMDYSLTMYYRESWRDKRVMPNSSLNKGSYDVPHYMMKRFWYPDIFMRNEKHSSMHNMMFDNRLLRFNSQGVAWHVRRITTTLSSPMNFRTFPFDIQFLPLIFESFSHTMDKLVMKWLDNPVQVDDHAFVPKYTFYTHFLIDCSQNYTTGAYPCLEIRFMLRRDLLPFIFNFFLPTIFLVITSWLTLWIRVDLAVHRIAVSSAALYLITVLGHKIREELPNVSYVTAGDVWTFSCFLLVLCTIIVHTAINFLLNLSHKPQKLDTDSEKQTEDSTPRKVKLLKGLKNIFLDDGLMQVSNVDKYKDKAKLVNSSWRLIMAAVFVLVIIIYFGLYTRPR